MIGAGALLRAQLVGGAHRAGEVDAHLAEARVVHRDAQRLRQTLTRQPADDVARLGKTIIGRLCAQPALEQDQHEVCFAGQRAQAVVAEGAKLGDEAFALGQMRRVVGASVSSAGFFLTGMTQCMVT